MSITKSTTDNQASRLPEFNSYEADTSLQYWMERALREASAAADVQSSVAHQLSQVGAGVGGWNLQDAADTANRFGPELKPFDRYGNRIDDVTFHPEWDKLLDTVVSSKVCGMPWLIAGAGLSYRGAAAEMWSRLDMGVMCPVSMTSAAVPVFQRAAAGPQSNTLFGDADAATWVHRLAHGEPRQYLAGMAMTEPQGGSDLSGSSTEAVDNGDGTHSLTGHKWFCSHPTGDVILMLGRESDVGEGSRGLSCFVVPRFLPDGRQNATQIVRLKDKLGTRSLASGELMLKDVTGWRIGEAGAGVRTIIDMVNMTRMDCALGSTGIITRAVYEAVQHCRTRQAFGKYLVDQPLMRSVLGDIALEREGALALAMTLCRSLEREDPLARLLTIIGKYWITRRAVSASVEVVECLGGNGYCEEFVPARLYRDAQVNSTWEGSGNVIVLDLFRALLRDDTLIEQLRHELKLRLNGGTLGSQYAERLLHALDFNDISEHEGRAIVSRMALVTQAVLLIERADTTGDEQEAIIARSFVTSRIESPVFERGYGAGVGSALIDAAEVLIPRYSVD